MNDTVLSPALEFQLVEKVTDLLNILSKKDAITIFLLAKDGLPAETDAPHKIGLTRKQYYTRLKQLVDSGLLEKSGSKYIHTTLGDLVYNKHILELAAHVKNTREMKIVDVLKKSEEFSESDIVSFLSKITGNVTTTRCSLLLSWEDMRTSIIEGVNTAQKEILLASRFVDENIINAMLSRVNVGIKVKVMADATLVKRYVSENLADMHNDKHAEERVNVATNPWYPSDKVERRYMSIPFSMVIIDEKEAAIELVDAYDTASFRGCAYIRDSKFAHDLRSYYNHLWSIASNDLQKLIGG